MKSYFLSTALFFCIFIPFAQAMEFDCVSESSLHAKNQDEITIHGNLDERGILTNTRLYLLDKNDRSEHILLEVPGPVEATRGFHPRTNKLRGFRKYILSQDRADSFSFFVPEAYPSGLQVAYVKFSFEGTYPELEEMACQSVQ